MKPILIFLLTLFILSCSPKTKQSSTTIGVTKDSIQLGSSSALKGFASFLGTQLTQGSMVYFNKVNEQGGIHGRKIQFIQYDDGYEPSKALENTTKLIREDKVFVLFDYVGTPTAEKIVKIVNETKTPLIGLFTGAEFLRNPYQPYIFNIRASYFMEVETMIDYWYKKGKKEIAVFYQNDAFGKAVLAGVRLALSRYNLEPVAVSFFERGTKPTKEQVETIRKANPDGVVMVGTYSPLAQFIKLAKESGITQAEFHTVSFVGSEAFAQELLSYNANLETDVYVTQVVPSPYDSTNKVVKEFSELYAKYYPNDKVNYTALEGYFNAIILVEALKRCGKDLTQENLIRSLESMNDFQSGIGFPSVVAAENHSFYEKVYISKIKDGTFKIIESYKK